MSTAFSSPFEGSSSRPPEGCSRCGAPVGRSSSGRLCGACAGPSAPLGGRDASVAESVAFAAILASATPLFIEAPDTLAFVRPGKAFALELDYAAIVSGLLALLLGSLAAALLRGTRPEGRGKVLLGVLVAGLAGAYELGLGLGLY